MKTVFPVTAKPAGRGRRALVWFENFDDTEGFFMFTCTERDGFTFAGMGGAERDLRTVDQLIAASYKVIEWDVEFDTKMKLKQLEVLRYSDPELRRLLCA